MREIECVGVCVCVSEVDGSQELGIGDSCRLLSLYVMCDLCQIFDECLELGRIESGVCGVVCVCVCV